MPRVELRDRYGVSYRCDTASGDLLRCWLEEWMPKLTQGHDEPLLMSVYPAWTSPDCLSQPDWITDTRFAGVLFEVGRTASEALAAMGRERARIRGLEKAARHG